MKITIGGNRVGSGKKMTTSINEYRRSTHNLSETFASSMGVGILYPALVKPAMRGDSFDIDIEAAARTIPTKGPLFGSYKMQVDVYQVPIRLYQGILHNNPLAIGLKMNQVLFPMIQIPDRIHDEWTEENAKNQGKFSTNSLMKYLGMTGTGQPVGGGSRGTEWYRKVNAIPLLAYFDIFKTYYANKQEEFAWQIQGNNILETNIEILSAELILQDSTTEDILDTTKSLQDANYISIEYEVGRDINEAEKEIAYNRIIETTFITYYGEDDNIIYNNTLKNFFEHYNIDVNKQEDFEITFPATYAFGTAGYKVMISDPGIQKISINKGIKLQKFDLSNIDNMRYELLSSNQLGVQYTINNGDNDAPYLALCSLDQEYITVGQTQVDIGRSWNAKPLNGLVVKTYQNDIYNNWLNSEWIEGENGINELSKVAIVDGAFSMDSLNFATKLYNMLNRVAVAGATYEDWQDVMYEEVKRRQIESPIFCGGMSQEVIFDEIVQTAPADGDPLGTLGGRGKLMQGSQNGGKIHIKCEEACFIMAIVSLTPRQMYTQGNEFYLTDLNSMDDLHKPGMDGIGFQDLIGERMAFFDTKIGAAGEISHRSKIGKLPAWIEYMTSVNKAYGDFAETDGKGYMILNRDYDYDTETGGILDATTYIDPSKYNYVFAYNELDAQNFWVMINFKITARRLMSARMIPNV